MEFDMSEQEGFELEQKIANTKDPREIKQLLMRAFLAKAIGGGGPRGGGGGGPQVWPGGDMVAFCADVIRRASCKTGL
jgi:hypothetical protein